MVAVFPLIALVTAFFGTLLFTAILIPVLKKKRLGQSILAIGPIWHKPKEGTPTMGGIVFLVFIPLGALLGELLFHGSISPTLVFLLLFAVANGLIGVIDDATKLKNKRNLGLLPWQKLFLQSFFVLGYLYLIWMREGFFHDFRLPFFNVAIPFSFPLLFLFFILLLGTVNCVNLSDGIDGLTGSSALVIGVFFLAVGVLFSDGTLLSLGGALSGGMLAFLLFNKNPARIFMGDTGSLFLGALLSGGAFLLPNPCVLPLYTLLFLIEGGSVILQVLCFKRTGRRLFRMAPLHHHLEKCAWSERRIVFAFSLLTALGAALALIALV